MKMVFVFSLLLCWLSEVAAENPQSTSTVDIGKPLKEPRYDSEPKYGLMTFGKNAEDQVWIVEDGKRLFVDQNANGDLTDDGPPLEPGDFSHPGTDSWSFKYRLDRITPTSGSRHTEFVLSRWNYREEEDSYGLSITVGGRVPMYAGWFGSFWSSKPETVPVIHFGGPFEPSVMRRDAFEIGETKNRLSLGLFRRGSNLASTSRISIDAVPAEVVPIIQIDWPTNAESSPLKTTHRLTERCCYWEFYTTKFEIPKGVTTGKARLSIDFPFDGIPEGLTTTNIELPVKEISKPTP